MKDILFTDYSLNNLLKLKNRIVMAPMTRNMANDDFSATDAMVDYYARRADAGLIITEGTIIGSNSVGFTNTPGIYTEKQIKEWRKVTDAVHQKGGLIFSQIWHVGRVSHPHYLNGQLPIGPSESTMTARVNRTKDLYYGKSRAATLDEIKKLINDFAKAAENAVEAGFDGVEIHGANGYLVDQFLHYHTNQRTDEYGGTPENMARFALDVVKACAEKIGYERVSLRLSPGAYLHEIIGDNRDAEVFKYLLKELSKLNIAYVHTGNFDDSVTYPELNNMTMTGFIRLYYTGTVIACGSYTFDEARDGIQNNEFDLIAKGRPFIANPDLIDRLQHKKEIYDYNRSMLETLY